MPALPRFLSRLIPPTPLSRRLSLQSMLFAIGEGTFMTASAVFFLKIVGVSASQIGLALTIGMLARLLTSYPAGKLADVVGPKRMWALGNLVSGSLFFAMPFVRDYAPLLVLLVLYEALNGAANSARIAYLYDVLPDEERVRTQAFLYSLTNLGFTIGALLGGLALAVPGDAGRELVTVLPFFTGVLGLVNSAYITRLPPAPHDVRAAERRSAAAGRVRRERPAGPGALRNPAYLVMSFCAGTLMTNQVLLHTVIPLWLIARTDAPQELLAWLFGTNTVLCIFLPQVVSRGVTDVSHALRAASISAVFFVGSCLITLVTHDTVGLLTVALVWLGHVTVTFAELYLTSAQWQLEYHLADPGRRGEYQGAGELSGTLAFVGAPAAYTFLAMNWGAAGWLVIALVVVVAAVVLHPASRAAGAFLERHRLVAAPDVS